MGGVSRRVAPVLALGLLLVACGSGDRPARVAPPSGAVDAHPSASPPSASAPVLGEGDFVAVPAERYLPMWETPRVGDGADFRLDTRNPLGQLTPLLIERATLLERVPWYEVLLPLRPNGSTAWVRASDVRVRERSERIVVDLSRRLLWHFRGDRLLHRFSVGVGTPRTPTGTGRFYVWVKVTYDDPGGPYGIAALGLSGFSPVLSDWPGEGRMAVHGTADPGDAGAAVSHGCVRLPNEDLEALLDVPLGTPVVIRP
jgi:hypothetical protein